jgi:hypothetical protein
MTWENEEGENAEKAILPLKTQETPKNNFY